MDIKDFSELIDSIGYTDNSVTTSGIDINTYLGRYNEQ